MKGEEKRAKSPQNYSYRGRGDEKGAEGKSRPKKRKGRKPKERNPLTPPLR